MDRGLCFGWDHTGEVYTAWWRSSIGGIQRGCRPIATLQPCRKYDRLFIILHLNRTFRSAVLCYFRWLCWVHSISTVFFSLTVARLDYTLGIVILHGSRVPICLVVGRWESRLVLSTVWLFTPAPDYSSFHLSANVLYYQQLTLLYIHRVNHNNISTSYCTRKAT